jgi:hypothetical protein
MTTETPKNFLLYAYNEWLPPIVDETTPPFILKPAKLPMETRSFSIQAGQKTETSTKDDLVPSFPIGVSKIWTYTFK